MNDVILVLNAGSSSIKFCLFACNATGTSDHLPLVYRGNIADIGKHAHFTVNDANHQLLVKQELGTADHEQVLTILLGWLANHSEGVNLIAAGHRVVHGGVKFTAPVKIDDQIMLQLEQFIPLAPLHQPHNLAAIKALSRIKKELPQVACFDTAFHCTQPPVAQAFALPRAITAQGIKRYGFHGLSYEYIANCLPQVIGHLPERVVVAHLGNGVSLCALKNGHSIATTMGFTALDGLPMGTRCGAIDAGVLLHLLAHGMDSATLSHLLYHQSGLLGVSGISNDMQELLASDSPHAIEAIELFVYRIGRELGALAATLSGLDALVFTAGIGQYAAPIRAQVCQQAAWLGVQLDTDANQRHAAKISTPDSDISVWVIPTDEEKMIAQHTYRCLSLSKT